jgi:hypothetical protein
MNNIGQFIIPHLSRKNVEIEFRFGTITNKRFDTNIGFENFQKVLRRLCKYTEWESYTISNDTIFYGEGGRRSTYNNDTDEDRRVIKTRIDTFDAKSSPMDVRVGISTEIPYEASENEEFTSSKDRIRHSFVRKNVRIDLSMLKGEPDDKDSETQYEHQLEIEIIDPLLVVNDHELITIIMKIYDILKILL